LRSAARVFPLVVTCALVLPGSPASAQGIFAGMQKGLETVFSSVSTTTTLASGAVTRTDTNNIYPALTLNFDTLIYPGVKMNAGGVFEINFLDINASGSRSSSTISRNRPYFQLRSTNPTLAPGFSYFRREERAKTAGLSDVKLVNEEYGAYLGWQPEGGPRSDLQLLRTHTFDGARAFQDITKGFGSLISTYARGNLGANYRGAYLDTDDQLHGLETRQVSHAGRVSYSDSFINKRLLWNATYNINYQDVRTASRGTGGEVALPVTPFVGLATLSDTPVTAKLTENPALIDSNLTAGAGIDLGLPTPPAGQQSRNIGLDLLHPAEVNRFLIWVDRELPFEIANSFSWEVYSSLDNIVWKRESIVGAARFGTFESRFEIDFSSVTARYVKVVTKPLSAVVQGSASYPDILVTEMQAFLRRPAGQVSSRVSNTTNILSTDVRMRLLDTPSLYYEGFYVYDGPNLAGKSTDTLSNGLSVNHAFGRIFSAYARAAYEQGRQPDGYRTAAVTNATLTVDPISTFRSSLLYTGQDERIAGLPRTRRGFFVQNSAQLYQGVDFLFGFGWNATTRETGEIAHDRLLNASATIVPRERVSLTFNYDDTTTRRSGTFVGSPQSHTRRLYAAVAVDPFRTLHVALGEEVIAISGQRTRTTFNIDVNFSPFPDGRLQFLFASNEALRALEFGKDRSTLGAVRWNISRRSYVDVSYQRTRSEFVFQTTESRIFSVTVRLFF